MESYRRFISAIVFIAGLTTSNVFGAFHRKMNGDRNDVSDITWAHAVNSWDALEKALSGPIDFLEADISLGHVIGDEKTSTVPIMAHPPDTISDVSLDTWLTTVLKRAPQKGIKLDFKSIEVVEPSLVILQKYSSKLNSSIWLNADVLSGPVKSSDIPVQVGKFLALCNQYFPKATLSIGWTTQWFPTLSDDSWHYGWNHVRKMADVTKCNKHKENSPKFTFPVRGIFTSRSIKQLQWLLSVVPDSTLTVWTGRLDPLQVEDLIRIRASFPKHRVYYDVPEKLNAAFKQKKDSVNVPDGNLFTDDQWVVFTRAQEDSCSTLTYANNNGILFGRSSTAAVLQKGAILSGSSDLTVTGRIEFFNEESRIPTLPENGMQELRIILVDVSLFAKNISEESGKVIDLTKSDTAVIWSAINSSTIYSYQHSYGKEDTSCLIFKLNTSEDKSFEVWTVPCDAMHEEISFEDISKTGTQVISSRKRLVVPREPFMLGFVSKGDEHVVIYDLTIKSKEKSTTSGTKPSVAKTPVEMFSTLISFICTIFILILSV